MMREGIEKGNPPPVHIVSGLLVNFLPSTLCCLLRRLRSLFHLFLGHTLGVICRVGCFALGGTQGVFSGIHHLLASVDCAGETLSDGLVYLPKEICQQNSTYQYLENINLVRDFRNLLGHRLPSDRGRMYLTCGNNAARDGRPCDCCTEHRSLRVMGDVSFGKDEGMVLEFYTCAI